MMEKGNNSETKAQWEKAVMRLFRETCPGFPHGRLIKTESPDFILKTSRKRSTGIEITRLYNPGPGEHNPDQEDPLRTPNPVLTQAQELFSTLSDLPLHVHVFFSEGKPAEKSSEIARAVKLAAIIDRHSSDFASQRKYVHRTLLDDIPDFTSRIDLFYDPRVTFSDWNPGEQFVIEGLDCAHICEAIAAKDEKLRLYQKKRADEYWLILVAGHLEMSVKSPGSFLDDCLVDSDFRRIFLFDFTKPLVIGLNKMR